MSTYPEDGAGTECLPADLECGVPIDTVVEIRFDRFLLPSSANRQSLALYTGERRSPVPPDDRLPELVPRYDVVERVVRFSLPNGATLQPNVLYTVELPIAAEPVDFGFRAFDGAPLDRTTTVRFSFLTSNQLDPSPALEDAPATCFDVVEGSAAGPAPFAHCALSSCHGSETPTMGLDLSSANGLLRTAIARVAHQTETGPTTGVPLESPARFGAAMPVIDPRRPDNSYLMYKLLRAPENYRLSEADPDYCGTAFRPPVDPGKCVPPSREEIARLRDWFLRGEAMPNPLSDASSWLVRAELRAVESWIRAGAVCP